MQSLEVGVQSAEVLQEEVHSWAAQLEVVHARTG